MSTETNPALLEQQALPVPEAESLVWSITVIPARAVAGLADRHCGRHEGQAGFVQMRSPFAAR